MKTIFNPRIALSMLFFCFAIQAIAQHELPKLNYDFGALEPFIDSQTMRIHYTKHHAGYVANLNKLSKGTSAEGMKMDELLASISKQSEGIRNNAGGHYNHSLFWTILTPTKNTQPSKRLAEAIQKQFGGLDSLKMLLNQAASTRFGSGWAWLSVDANKKLVVSSTANQDNPMMDVVEKKGTPILGIDVWEHAYYLKYQNKRGDYLTSIWNVINWDEVSRRFEALVPKGKFDDWQELKTFHTVMSETFHPSEDGNLAPIKARSGEMVTKATALSKSVIPAEFNNKDVIAAIKKLAVDSKKLDKLVQKKASDYSISKSLLALHDTFHLIVERCVAGDHEH